MPAWTLGATGTACAALGLCVLIARRARRTAAPFVAAGQLSLTIYVVQALVIRWTPEPGATTIGQHTLIAAGLFAACACFAWAWRQKFRRGPLEQVLHALARP